MTHDIFTMASSKAIEYGLAIGYLVAFVAFWRYVHGGTPATAPAFAAARRAVGDMVEWFRVAAGVAFHPGHAWARIDQPGVAVVGGDDFTQKLLGRIARVDLPPVGTELRQGEPAWRFHVDGREIAMLAPVAGVVTDVNREVAERPSLVNDDPYGAGWLLKVEGPQVESTGKGLLTGALARKWIAEATDALRLRMTPDLGLALQDGGVPVDGLAQAIDQARWDEIAREHLLS